ncbi:hypothetical protein Esi_0006_0189 [Ectocarpus siliculosus]|uniref:Uncharacterized protein n=1 Tax=Ectocarpus siliculosus TaxID=2880 RepID=D8LQL9_ECTSI|nr:hypothetical protein Esi_0006_0189 [Ectocarpus siliculosus]|eukprot:CBN78783.1 hypothetical protein Esi_0006_0189 [Ectocarpus siliculosus]
MLLALHGKRLLKRADLLVQEERGRLLRELHAELDVERKKFEARKPAISEEIVADYDSCNAWAILAYPCMEYALIFLLFCGPHDKGRALHEGEAAFGHSCRLIRQQSDHNIQAKIDAMGGEAAIAQEIALAALREVEASITEEELSRVTSDLEGDRREAETELKRQLHREAARSINLAVEACTSKHKRVQHETTVRAAEALRQALDAAGEDEVTRTKVALGR